MDLGLDNVNWENTNNNILGKLLLYGKICEYADFINLSRTRMYEIFDKRHPTVDELSIYSKILDVPMNELIVYKDDIYCPYDIDGLTQNWKNNDDSTKEERIEEISGRIHFNQLLHDSSEIRNLTEFLLYLPLMQPSLLFEYLGRIGGNFETSNNDYITGLLNRLYDAIPSSPAKEYADWYRDTHIRARGDYHPSLFKETIEQSGKSQSREKLFNAYSAFVHSDHFQQEFGCDTYDKRRFAIRLYEEAYNKAVEEQNNRDEA